MSRVWPVNTLFHSGENDRRSAIWRPILPRRPWQRGWRLLPRDIAGSEFFTMDLNGDKISRMGRSFP